MSELRRELEAQLVCELSVVYEPDEAVAWMTSPQPLLDNEVPLYLLRNGRGDEVRDLIGRIMGYVGRPRMTAAEAKERLP